MRLFFIERGIRVVGRGTVVLMAVVMLVSHRHNAMSRPALRGFDYAGADQLQPLAGVVEIVVRHVGQIADLCLGGSKSVCFALDSQSEVDGISTEELPSLGQESRLLRGLYCNSTGPLLCCCPARGGVPPCVSASASRIQFFQLTCHLWAPCCAVVPLAYSGPGSLM